MRNQARLCGQSGAARQTRYNLWNYFLRLSIIFKFQIPYFREIGPTQLHWLDGLHRLWPGLTDTDSESPVFRIALWSRLDTVLLHQSTLSPQGRLSTKIVLVPSMAISSFLTWPYGNFEENAQKLLAPLQLAKSLLMRSIVSNNTQDQHMWVQCHWTSNSFARERTYPHSGPQCRI